MRGETDVLTRYLNICNDTTFVEEILDFLFLTGWLKWKWNKDASRPLQRVQLFLGRVSDLSTYIHNLRVVPSQANLKVGWIGTRAQCPRSL